MNVDLMRKIDHHLGIPLTFVSTYLLKVAHWITRKKATTPKNILFVELSEMGSTIIADPAMKRAQKRFNANLFFVIFSKNKPSLDLLNTIPQENIFTLCEDNLFTLMRDAVRYLFWCRRNKIDTAIDLELFSRVSALLTGFSGANNRVGYHNFHGEGLYRGEMLTHKVTYNPHIHIAKNFIALIHALEAKTEEVPYSKVLITDHDIQLDQVSFNQEEKVFVYDKIQACFPAFNKEQHQLILMNPNASDLLPQRRWPKENFIALMQAVLARYENAIILITGAPNEQEEAEALRLQVGHERCVNFAGQLKLLEMPILYTVSRLMVTNDSGPGHFSSITPLKTFVLFGPETPKLYGSLGNSTPLFAGLACSPCVSAANHRKTPCTEPVCMDAITVDQVIKQIEIELKDPT
ncbi:glycosyltransferase family 9 protein [Hydrogenovibrio crunogenus]|uniref:Glycosyltransferase family 9 protein n=1 Tax=Hydrogenovibrio crunogenus TaxID=39765 RepID=A0A4V1C910_9GAMM|nr:glycosyltransferase family 9 protein [Hydrogenovibrio crunogenus]QBZ83774.1 glycosyltransferase family 9 protein [Hydrogenovibrio crunogenus]